MFESVIRLIKASLLLFDDILQQVKRMLRKHHMVEDRVSRKLWARNWSGRVHSKTPIT